MNRRPALPSNAGYDLLADLSDRLNRLERGYHRSGGASFGLPFQIGNWVFEEVHGDIQISDMTTGKPVGISVLDNGSTIVGTAPGLAVTDTPATQTLPAGGITYPITLASTRWTVPHTLGFDPSVTCQDSTGREFWPEAVTHSPGLIVIDLLASTAGKVTLS